jgi:hypothetical protein
MYTTCFVFDFKFIINLSNFTLKTNVSNKIEKRREIKDRLVS